MTPAPGPDGVALEDQVGQWRSYVQRHRTPAAVDVDELEDQLRDQIAGLQAVGLSGGEAFLVAVSRIGALDDVSREFAVEHSHRLWEQLVLTGGPESQPGRRSARGLAMVLGLAVGAALAIKVPVLFGLDLGDAGGFYARNLSLFVLPFLACYFAWARRMGAPRSLWLLAPPFLLGAVFANVYPFATGGSTEILTTIHLPIVMWTAMGLAHVGGDWRSGRRRMDFIRFTGEWVVYYVLLALGGGVLMGLTTAVFAALGLDATRFLTEWVVPCGAVGAVLVAAWLVEAKQDVVENIAPVLTRVFTPLTAVMLLAFLVAIPATGTIVEVNRDLLILIDLILVLVLGLLLYGISARDPLAPPDTFDRLQLVLVVTTLAVDALMLAAMLSRIAEFGTSPNKVAALGLNLVLLVNLAWSARLGVGFLRARRPFADLERWQTDYLPVYAAWAAVVVIIFPPAFHYT